MPKYLVEIILVVNAENADEAKRIANYILDLSIPDKGVENAIDELGPGYTVDLQGDFCGTPIRITIEISPKLSNL